jgi:hypothetical protein
MAGTRPTMTETVDQLVIAGLVPAISLRRAGQEKSPAEAGLRSISQIDLVLGLLRHVALA